MKLGIGLQNDRFALCISSMLGEEKMPYCWAAKSKRKHVGASHLAVEYEIPMLIVFEL